MNKRKKIISVFAGIMAFVLLLSLILGILPSLVSAKSSSEIKDEINDYKKQQSTIKAEINNIKSQISANMDDIQDIINNKNLIDQEVALLYTQVDNINNQISAYSALIADKQEELDAAQARLQALKQKNKERIRAMEEAGKLSYWSVLFQANSFSDLLDRINMMQEIAASDNRRIKQMNEATAEVEAARDALTTEKQALEGSRAELEGTMATLEQRQAESNKLLTKLLEKGAEFDKLLETAEEKADALSASIAKLNTDLKAAEKREYEEWLKNNPVDPNNPYANTVNGVIWLLPINYTRVTSPFGPRVHPITGEKGKMHKGIDLAAPSGTPIYATRSGIVDYVGFEADGAGNWVQINHQDGFKTQYMHMTRYVVKWGQRVKAGELIGYCGSTGGSTGPHLHFGVFLNGTAVNPANYIKLK